MRHNARKSVYVLVCVFVGWEGGREEGRKEERREHIHVENKVAAPSVVQKRARAGRS